MVTKVQSETTYEVQYEGRDFMVTVFQDIQSGIIEYDTFDCETCADVDGDLELNIIRFLEENLLD